MTVGTLICAGGPAADVQDRPGASYLVDVLPAGPVRPGPGGAVAPLTATVLATADERHAGVASGVNNAVARTGGLLAVAAIPPLAGLTGEAFASPSVFTSGFHTDDADQRGDAGRRRADHLPHHPRERPARRGAEAELPGDGPANRGSDGFRAVVTTAQPSRHRVEAVVDAFPRAAKMEPVYSVTIR